MSHDLEHQARAIERLARLASTPTGDWPSTLSNDADLVEALDAALVSARALRNMHIYQATETGLCEPGFDMPRSETERSAAKAARVAYSWAGRCRRSEGRPEAFPPRKRAA